MMLHDILPLFVLLIVAYALGRVVDALRKLADVVDTHTRHMHKLAGMAWGENEEE